MKISIHSTSQLASVLGLSRWTVSRALNGHPGVNPDTVVRVREAARAAGFAPNVLGRGLRSGKTDLIGVCLPDLEDYFLTPKISRLQEAVSEQGLQTLLQMTNGSEASESAALGRFAAMRCCGVVVIASRLEDGHGALRNLRELGIPVVFVDPFHKQSGAVVATDRGAAMQKIIAHLHESGHRTLVAVGIDPKLVYGAQRAKGLRAGCRKWAWDFVRDVHFLNSVEAVEDIELGRGLAVEYLRLHYPRTRAVVALNDRIACGMIQHFRKKRIRVPEDVAVVGYDASAFSEVVAPALTTVDPCVSELIDEAVSFLLTERTPESVWVKPKLVVRGST